jgi:hypothetical protein
MLLRRDCKCLRDLREKEIKSRCENLAIRIILQVVGKDLMFLSCTKMGRAFRTKMKVVRPIS